MGNQFSNNAKQMDDDALEKTIDYIASSYILTMDFQSLRKLYEKDYCDKLVLLTTDVIQKYFTTVEIANMKNRIQFGKDKTMYATGENMEKLMTDGTNNEEKVKVCSSVAKFYIKIAHLFSAIVTTINPEYVYRNDYGQQVKKGLLQKNEIPPGVSIQKVNMNLCASRFMTLQGKMDNPMLSNPYLVPDEEEVGPNEVGPSPTEQVTSPTLPQPEPVLVASPPEPVIVTSPTKPNLVASPTEPVVVASPTEPVIVASPTEPVVVATPTIQHETATIEQNQNLEPNVSTPVKLEEKEIMQNGGEEKIINEIIPNTTSLGETTVPGSGSNPSPILSPILEQSPKQETVGETVLEQAPVEKTVGETTLKQAPLEKTVDETALVQAPVEKTVDETVLVEPTKQEIVSETELVQSPKMDDAQIDETALVKTPQVVSMVQEQPSPNTGPTSGLSSGPNTDPSSIIEPDENVIQVNPQICTMNPEGKTLDDEPGIPELMELYNDDGYDYETGEFTSMSEATQDQFRRDLKRFYTTFTGETSMPDDIKTFRDIKLKNYNKEPVCVKREINMEDTEEGKIANENARMIRDGFQGTHKDKLFVEYANNLKKMMQSVNQKQQELLTVLNQMFAYVEDPETSQDIVLIHPDLTEQKLQELIVETRGYIIELYLNCETDFLHGLQIYEAIVNAKILDTSQNQIGTLGRLVNQFFSLFPSIGKAPEQALGSVSI